jgi:hypothetical protein
MISTLNPLAAEFFPAQVQDEFHEAKQVINQLKALRALEAQVKQISKITNYDGLEQVAQITYNNPIRDEYYELFWDGEHAIIDCSYASWQYPDMTIRHIVHHHFDENGVISLSDTIDQSVLDEPASYSPAIQLTLYPNLS